MVHSFSGRLGGQSPQQGREAMLQYQQRSLQRMLQYVWKHSAFYRDYYTSSGIREADLSDLTIRDLPVLSKQTLIEQFDEVVSVD
jgi:phenylacetate-CoA ligase